MKLSSNQQHRIATKQSTLNTDRNYDRKIKNIHILFDDKNHHSMLNLDFLFSIALILLLLIHAFFPLKTRSLFIIFHFGEEKIKKKNIYCMYEKKKNHFKSIHRTIVLMMIMADAWHHSSSIIITASSCLLLLLLYHKHLAILQGSMPTKFYLVNKKNKWI